MVEIVGQLDLPLLIGAGAALLALVVSHVAHRFSMPAPALFLALGILVNATSERARDWIHVDDVAWIGSMALVLILFEGGFSGGWRRTRASIGPILALGVVGTLMTSVLLAVASHAVLGLSWATSIVIGVALAPTDPAAVFSVFGNRDVRGRSGAIVEGESGFNDPVSIALMVGALTYIVGTGSRVNVAVDVIVGLGVGCIVGFALGDLSGRVLGRVSLRPENLFPFAAIAAVFVTYAAANLLHGSGFLSVLVAGLVMGDRLRPHRGIESLAGLCSGLSEIAMFSVLGLTVSLTSLEHEVGSGLVIFGLLTFVVRPAVVGLLLAPARLAWVERMFVGWGGLKGAVPILLAAFAMLADVRDAQEMYAIVFVAVAASIVVQGGTIPAVVRALGLSEETETS